jgi:protein TonB
LAAVASETGRFDRLGSTIFVAILAHGVIILGVTFAPALPKPPKELPTMNVTLLVDTGEIAQDVDTNLLAERNQAGGSDGAEARPTRTLTSEQLRSLEGTPLGADAVDAEALPADSPADQLVSRSPSDRQVEAVPDTTDDPAPTPMTAAALMQQAAPESLIAEIDDTATSAASDDADNAAPSTRESALARYMVGWRQRVERVGTANFPLDEVGHIAQRPIVEVSIDAGGSLHDIVLRRSSGNSRLDESVLTILEMAAPFEAVPEAVLADSGMLRFAYEWDFSSGAR